MMPTNPGFQGPTPPVQQPAQTMQLPVQPPAEQSPGRRRRWLRCAVPLVAFLLGIGVGGSGDQPDVTTTPQYQSLQAELDTAQDEAGELGDDVAAAEEQVRQAGAAAQAQIEQQTAAISQRAAALDQREQDLTARESALRAAEQAAGSSRSSTGTGSSSSSSASVSSGAGSASVVEPEAQVSASASYANCSAARAAGAAPVRVGDPGYGRHLDRDGDGVGCE
jgi:multidrug efflux pump subunit AcrA (membrane-fusion protein)